MEFGAVGIAHHAYLFGDFRWRLFWPFVGTFRTDVAAAILIAVLGASLWAMGQGTHVGSFGGLMTLCTGGPWAPTSWDGSMMPMRWP